ncbi:MAG: YbaK/EbsC family protein [Chloroflexi bacterium]|nr:YbaK/EbsC family protein [Chloroflexota bacterium]
MSATAEPYTIATSPLLAELRAAGVPYRLFVHPEPPASLAQAAQARGQRLEQIVRSLLFRDPEHRFIMLLLPGGYRADWSALRRYLGQRRLTLARPEEVLEVTGFPIGAVGPLGLRRPVRLLADERIFEPEEVSLGSGVRGVAVLLRSADLRRVLRARGAEIGRFGVLTGAEAHET